MCTMSFDALFISPYLPLCVSSSILNSFPLFYVLRVSRMARGTIYANFRLHGSSSVRFSMRGVWFAKCKERIYVCERMFTHFHLCLMYVCAGAKIPRPICAQRPPNNIHHNAQKIYIYIWSSLVDCRCAKFVKFQLFSIALCEIILRFFAENWECTSIWMGYLCIGDGGGGSE